MSSHPFDNDFNVSPEQKEKFQRDGFVKLEGFLDADVVNALLARVDLEMNRGDLANLKDNNLKDEKLFTRAKYDFESDKSEIYELIGRPFFRRALTDLGECDLFLTFELCFEIEKNVSQGFPWHVGVQSFGYQMAEEFGVHAVGAAAPCRYEGAAGRDGLCSP